MFKTKKYKINQDIYDFKIDHHNIRETVIWIVLSLSILTVVFTEIFSLFQLLNSQSVKFLWLILLILFIFYCFFTKGFKIKIDKIFNSKFILNLEFFWIIVIFLIIFLISLIYPPNTLDSLSYHFPRILMWIQQESVNFYPTNDLRELVMGPFPHYVITHLYLLSGGDFFANTVQWIGMFICCITVSLISKEFGCNFKFQIFSMLFCATIPMGILQSTSTQTDYVATMWLSLISYSLIRFIKFPSLKYIFLFSSSLGLGILTKGTIYLFGLPFCIWMGIHLIFKFKKNLVYMVLIPLVVVIINLGHFTKNQNLTNNPIGLSKENNIYTNKIINFSSLTSNLLRNTGLNLAVPNKQVNIKITKKIVDSLHKLIGISSRDPRTTKTGGYYIPFSFYESSAPNTLHFIIIIISFVFLLRKRKYQKQNFYIFSILLGYILFSLIMIWAIQNNRHLLSLLVISSPIVAFSLMKMKIDKFKKIISILLILYSIPYLLFNKSRPLVGELTVVENKAKLNKPFYREYTDKNKLYYVADNFFRTEDLYEKHIKVTQIVKNLNCKFISFDMPNYTNLIYPLMKMIKEKTNKDIKFYRSNITNDTSNYLRKINEDKNCIINFEKNYVILADKQTNQIFF